MKGLPGFQAGWKECGVFARRAGNFIAGKLEA